MVRTEEIGCFASKDTNRRSLESRGRDASDDVCGENLGARWEGAPMQQRLLLSLLCTYVCARRHHLVFGRQIAMSPSSSLPRVGTRAA